MRNVQILVLDFGSQYTQLIARRLREYGIYTEIIPYFEKISYIKEKNPKGIILSGGPASVYEDNAYKPDSRIFKLGIPILGICYGMQYIAHFFGGNVIKAQAQEFGRAVLEILESKWIQNSLTKDKFGNFNTPRCIVREYTQQDFNALYKLVNDKKTMHAWGGGFNEEETQKWLDTQIDRYKKFGFGLWAIIEKKSKKLIGNAGVNYTTINLEGDKKKKKILELNYIIHHSLWNQNYGFEVASECVKYAFNEIKAKEIYCLIKEDNFASLKLAKKLGMYIVGKIIKTYKGKDLTHYCLKIQENDIQDNIVYNNGIFANVKQNSIVWMSHADKVETIPNGFIELAKSGNTKNCAIADLERKIYALQFHPEVIHSECGGKILKNFALDICKASSNWNMKNFIESEVIKLRRIVYSGIQLDSITEVDIKRKARCSWAEENNNEQIYLSYHDNEWGIPLHDDIELFKYLMLESFQAGLSWLTILKKRDNFKKAFDDFNPKLIAKYDKDKILELMRNDNIIRNRLKIEAAIKNAQKFLEIQEEFGSFDNFIWNYVGNTPIINNFNNCDEIPSHTPLSDKISKDLKKRGFKFVGSITIYAFMQAIGMVNDHIISCHTRKNLRNKTRSNSKVLCAVSGGVDSSVVAALLYHAIGENLIPVFVDTGLLRKGERESVEKMFRENLKVPLITADASELFLKRLKGVIDPEIKRKIIGETFIEVFEKEAKKHNKNGEIKFLAQGTLYPDVIESVSVKGPSKTIKSHHNVGGLPEWMKFELIEPLRELFKDEVRALGRELGMPESMLMRHPFPGPGLAIRIMGEVNKRDLDLLREADSIFIDELHKQGFYDKVWQAFCVLLNVRSVGVMGDNRTYDNTICIRAVEAVDGMTATFAHLPHSFLESVSSRIINEVKGINRVVYDITSKPPGTIEWE